MSCGSGAELLHSDGGAAAATSEGVKEKPLSHSSSYDFLPPYMSGLTVVLLGNSWSERGSVGSFILRETEFSTEEEPDCCYRGRGQFKEKYIVVINTPDLLHPNVSEETLRRYVEDCVRLSDPGPHVFLLVLQPEDFTEQQKQRLCRVLQLFSDQSFDHSLVLTTREKSPGSMKKYMENSPLKDMIRKCRYRHLKQKNLDHSELLTRLGQTVKENTQQLSCDVFEDEDVGLRMTQKSEHNKTHIVLCGRRGAVKSSAAKVILGQTKLHSASNSSECVKHQAEVCGRQVSLVELPALCGKPQEEVMKESFRCISLCDPEGVHAFILVLPVGPVTDEDIKELETIHNTFSSGVNNFTMILFTVESDPKATAVVDFIKKNREIQELCQSCGGRYVVLNIKDQHQVSELLDTVGKMRAGGSGHFTKDMFTKAQMEKVVELLNSNIKLRAELQDVKSQMGGDVGLRSREPLRMVLIGKTGSGKSATANTILGKKHFKPRIAPKPPTKSCEKATGEIDGQPVEVINTPGSFDRSLTDDYIKQELQRCIAMLAPGPHVFLLVLQIGNFTPEEKDSMELIKRVFGKKAGDFTIIIFTRGEDLEDQSFDTYIKGCDDFLKQLIDDCGGRYQLFNNKDKTNCTQVPELLTKIQTMVENNGRSCYTTEMLDDTEETMQKQMERVMKENQEEIKEMKRKHSIESQKLKRKMNEEIEQQKELRKKQLKDKDEFINKEREERKKERDEDEKRRKKQEETLRQEWRRKLEASEKRVEFEREQRETAERKLEQSRKEMKRDQDVWEKERRDMWERITQDLKQSLDEEKTSFRKLQEEYHRKRRKWTVCYSVMMLFLGVILSHVLLR